VRVMCESYYLSLQVKEVHIGIQECGLNGVELVMVMDIKKPLGVGSLKDIAVMRWSPKQ
jgi:hypothetical protein